MTDADRGQVSATAADVYEEFFVPALFGQWTDPMLRSGSVEPGHRVLDVGCGTGVLARAAARVVGAEGSVTGIDPNPGMLAVARRSTESVHWREGIAEELPFADSAFDRVLSQFAAMFFENQETAMTEMARTVAPGGQVVMATWAAVETSPGYAAMVDLIDSLFGTAAADALRAPFSLGDGDAVRRLLDPVFEHVEVVLHDGTARFESIDTWVHTDVYGWTLAGMIDEDGHRRLLAEARTVLAPFADATGRVSFAAPALVATAMAPTER